MVANNVGRGWREAGTESTKSVRRNRGCRRKGNSEVDCRASVKSWMDERENGLVERPSLAWREVPDRY